MEKEIRRFNGRAFVVNALESCALIILLVCAAALCYFSMTETSRIDPLRYMAQHIQGMYDNPLFNAIVTLGVCALLRVFFLFRVSPRFVKIAARVLLPLVAAFGIVWVVAAKAIPTSDAGILYQVAISVIRGETAGLSDPTSYFFFYFVRFPFQFGFLSYMELIVRVFGEHGALVAMPVLNVLYLVSAYYALLRTTDALFAQPRVTLLTLLFLCACLQPVLACTWMYGLIPAFCCTAWGMLFFVRYLQGGKRRSLAGGIAAFVLAVYLKPNAWVPVAAVCIVLVLSALRHKRVKNLVAALLLIVACLPLPKAAQAAYEARIGTEFGKGYPMSSWMAMGMRESSMASGWYNGYSEMLYTTYGTDMEACGERVREDIAASVQGFLADKDNARRFYTEKLTTQWNEPTFMSLWLSMSCEPYAQRGAFARQMYDFDGLGGRFAWVENYDLQLLYFGFMLCVLCLFFDRREEMLLFPLVILGGVLYHLLFEASAKYTLSYAALLCPLAAYGIFRPGRAAIERRLAAYRQKRRGGKSV